MRARTYIFRNPMRIVALFGLLTFVAGFVLPRVVFNTETTRLEESKPVVGKLIIFTILHATLTVPAAPIGCVHGTGNMCELTWGVFEDEVGGIYCDVI